MTERTTEYADARASRERSRPVSACSGWLGGRSKRNGRTTRRKREVFLEVAARDGARCAKCGRRDKLTLDHVVPKSKGGKLEAANVQILCRYCNSHKGNASRDFRKTT